MQLVEELHLARSERRLEVNLVENCGELTCMDIDPPEEGASTMLSKSPVKKFKIIYYYWNVDILYPNNDIISYNRHLV